MANPRIEPKTPHERWRWDTVRTKEPGTIKWLEAQVKPGDIVYDIGANVGVYTMLAALLVGEEGCVYAFEPHIPTAKSLLNTVGLNLCGKRVTVFTVALHNRSGYFPFNYAKMAAGTSGHQLGKPIDEFEQPFDPIAVEQKYATTVDELLDGGTIQPATIIKLDVDGNELAILQGMTSLLDHRPPRSIQVEVHPHDRSPVLAFMQTHGYRLDSEHYTEFGQMGLDQGIDPARIAHNAVFVRV